MRDSGVKGHTQGFELGHEEKPATALALSELDIIHLWGRQARRWMDVAGVQGRGGGDQSLGVVIT